jgi:four helix bundle protein
MNSYRDLEIYQLSRKLANEVHKVSLTLPKFELYEEGQQVRRSSKAVAASIVEGYARRRYKKEYIKYLVYSQGECDETILHLDFLMDNHPSADHSALTGLRSKYDELSRMINRFTSWIEHHFIYRRD